jgi:hypothetical protein
MQVEEPEWFAVVGGPPPGEVVLRDLLGGLFVLFIALLVGLTLPVRSMLLVLAAAAGLSAATVLLLRQQWRRSQYVRVYGNILEHRDGRRVVRVVLSRAVLSAAVAPPGMLVLMLDDGRGQVTLARRAEPHELLDLPPCLGSYLELRPEDFEQIRNAAHRSYPQA